MLFTTNKRDIDLADTLMLSHPYNSRRICLGVRTEAKSWEYWDEKRLEEIERLVRYDIAFDGYSLTLKKLCSPGDECSSEFRWQLQIRS